uniref:Protein FAM221B n=1 Tax=Phallusia mammillata TaxID=59560 RepID=A0A6F9DD41_9ASCI|nr:protein FAM221B [Phallusia mammillata]
MEEERSAEESTLKQQNDSERPATSATLSLGAGLNEGGPETLVPSKFHPGRPGFAGSKLKVAKRSYTAHPIVPAESNDVVSVAKAMHREKFGSRLQKLFEPETEAAIKAMQSGVYVGWRCPEYTWDCIRVGDTSMCFCGHNLTEHKQYEGVKSQAPCSVRECRCRSYAFIPSRPEDVGEFWLQRRPSFDPSKWKAKCRCKHPHTDHCATGLRQCSVQGCRCGQFQSNFLCAACDRHWEEHGTFFDTEDKRVKKGLPHGEEYLPFAEIPRLRNMALTGKGNDSRKYRSLTNGSAPPLAIKDGPKPAQVDNNTPVPFGYQKPKQSPFA